MNACTILITGSGGFMGSHIVNEALKRNLNTFAGVRSTSNRKHLTHPDIKFAEFDLSSPSQIRSALNKIMESYGSLDYIIHNAGITKSLDEHSYFTGNTYTTKNLIDVINEAGIKLKKLILVSSLAAYGPGDPVSMAPIKSEHSPAPVTSYGKSKFLAEQVVMQRCPAPWAIIRPTAVYGPGEKEIFAFFRLVNWHIYPVLYTKNQQLSFIYVKDLARAILDVTLSSHINKSYFVSDGSTYSSMAFGDYVKKHLGKRTLKVKVSGNTLNFLAHTLERIYSTSKKTPGLNVAKAKELTSLNWNCDIIPLMNDVGFMPEYNLENGIKETIEWYRQENWL